MTHARDDFIIRMRYPPPDDPYLVKVCAWQVAMHESFKEYARGLFQRSSCKDFGKHARMKSSNSSSNVEEEIEKQSRGEMSKNGTPSQYSTVSI